MCWLKCMMGLVLYVVSVSNQIVHHYLIITVHPRGTVMHTGQVHSPPPPSPHVCRLPTVFITRVHPGVCLFVCLQYALGKSCSPAWETSASGRLALPIPMRHAGSTPVEDAKWSSLTRVATLWTARKVTLHQRICTHQLLFESLVQYHYLQ